MNRSGDITGTLLAHHRKIPPPSSDRHHPSTLSQVFLFLQLRDGVLSGEQVEALLARHALLGELVVGREARGVRRLRGGPVGRRFLWEHIAWGR